MAQLMMFSDVAGMCVVEQRWCERRPRVATECVVAAGSSGSCGVAVKNRDGTAGGWPHAYACSEERALAGWSERIGLYCIDMEVCL